MLEFENKVQNMQQFMQDFALCHGVLGTTPLPYYHYTSIQSDYIQ